MKVVINRCFGGFSLSKEAYDFLGLEWDGYGFAFKEPEPEIRTDPKLIECVKTLGSKKASGRCAQLKVVRVPDNIEWYIDNYDGLETVEEVHRTWC
jgi:hypothetical protein